MGLDEDASPENSKSVPCDLSGRNESTNPAERAQGPYDAPNRKFKAQSLPELGQKGTMTAFSSSVGTAYFVNLKKYRPALCPDL